MPGPSLSRGDVKLRVAANTQPAKKALRDLDKEVTQASARVGRRGVGPGRRLGLIGAIGAAKVLAGGAPGAIGGLLSETLTRGSRELFRFFGIQKGVEKAEKQVAIARTVERRLTPLAEALMMSGASEKDALAQLEGIGRIFELIEGRRALGKPLAAQVVDEPFIGQLGRDLPLFADIIADAIKAGFDAVNPFGSGQGRSKE